MKRALSWVLFVLALAVVVKLASHIRNPWASDNFKPKVEPSAAAAALYIPGCKDKGACS